MPQIPSHFQLDFQPVANPEAIVVAGSARFMVLTSRLIRLEYDENGRFQNAPSQPFWYRNQPVPDFEQVVKDGTLKITTEHLQLSYQIGKPFSADNLQITLKDSGTVWQFGDDDAQNLRGTYRTLDEVSGSTPLEPGLLSRSGWAVVDDSHTLIFNGDGWLEPRPNPDALDLYFFGYGRDYTTCLRDYFALTGPVPLLPRWALGNWWSRYWAYTQEELTQLMRDFRAHDVPLSVCIVDMDWHLDGWTGYTWNRELFPDPPSFISWLHEYGLRTALNLHPADGVGPHEAQYEAMAERLGKKPDGRPIPFDIANPDFARAYFELLHNPHEANGVDFWWVDWQQGELSSLPGLDPLWWLNHLHFYDLAREGGKRPFIFSRWGGLGNHRYPIGFSGDTHVDWDSLNFQPYFTATAANVGYSWWSHDIGGHMLGLEEPELYARWVQFGVFSPIFRLHSTNNPFHDRRPWGYDAETLTVTRDAMQLRHALIPYLYSLSWRNATQHQAPIRPMYHDYPTRDEAYLCPQQYTFGPDLIAAPHTTPADPDTQMSRQVVWLPPGTWHHFFSGEQFVGDSWQVQYGRLHHIPLFAKAGAIVPLGPKVGWGGVENPELIDLHCFAGASGEFTLYEDDGETLAYQNGRYALTQFTQEWQEDQVTITIHPADGETSHIPAERSYCLHLRGLNPNVTFTAWLDGQPLELHTSYDNMRESWFIGATIVSASSKFSLTASGSPLVSPRDRLVETIEDMLRAFRLETLVKAAVFHNIAEIIDKFDTIRTWQGLIKPSQYRALAEVIEQAGAHTLPSFAGGGTIHWDNKATS
ncbi:TIM-barrel domain-containing protein [Candidatus Leptofilum sp.]|uniref:glycoside hydrolase family 31 protein n=1 Tax=Candidatus Leptofilum sp. TaxID=3241576 RepID=UPI003B5C9FC9